MSLKTLSRSKSGTLTKKKTFPVRISTMDAELEFEIEKNTTGRELFDLVCQTIGLREKWYFGLHYVNGKGHPRWLSVDKKVFEQDIPDKSPINLLFLVKYYPEDASTELILETTQHLFFLQVKQAIVNMDIYCPPEAAVLLASYAVQAKYGDYDEATCQSGMLSMEELLPQRVIDQYQLTPEMWADKIRTWYADHKGTRDEATMEYLKIAQDLDMYGINYFPIKNTRGSSLWLGVAAHSVLIYEQENRLIPKISFPWSEVKKVSFKGKKFKIRLVDKKPQDFIFLVDDRRTNELILELCTGNQELFRWRREPDTIEIQQMKAQAAEEKNRRQVEYMHLLQEKEAKEQAQFEKLELEQRLFDVQDQMKEAQEALARAEQMADLWSEKAKIVEEEALLLTKKASDFEAENQRVKALAVKAEEEKTVMESRLQQAELIAASVLEDYERRSQEMEQLREELLKARLAEKTAREKLQEYIIGSQVGVPRHTDFVYDPVVSDLASSWPIDGANDDMTDPLGSNQLSLEMEKERRDYLEKSKHVQHQLNQLRSEIDMLKVLEKRTHLDQLHDDNQQHGKSKYATFSQPRGHGNNPWRQLFGKRK